MGRCRRNVVQLYRLQRYVKFEVANCCKITIKLYHFLLSFCEICDKGGHFRPTTPLDFQSTLVFTSYEMGLGVTRVNFRPLGFQSYPCKSVKRILR